MVNKQHIEYIQFLLKRNYRMIVLFTIAMTVFFPLLVLSFSSFTSASQFLVMTGRTFYVLLSIAAALVSGYLSFFYIN